MLVKILVRIFNIMSVHVVLYISKNHILTCMFAIPVFITHIIIVHVDLTVDLGILKSPMGWTLKIYS